MNKEELIGKLQMTYVGDINALNELVGYYDGLKQGIEELQQENKQLKEELDKYKHIVEEIKKELLHLRTITFTKENGNEWNNCLSFNDDVLPILKRIKHLESEE